MGFNRTRPRPRKRLSSQRVDRPTALEESRFGPRQYALRIQVYCVKGPQNDIAGGSRERPRDLPFYRSVLNNRVNQRDRYEPSAGSFPGRRLFNPFFGNTGRQALNSQGPDATHKSGSPLLWLWVDRHAGSQNTFEDGDDDEYEDDSQCKLVHAQTKLPTLHRRHQRNQFARF